MKIFNILLILICLLINVPNGHSQAVVCGFNYDSDDGFTIVATEDLPASTVLFVSETDYNAATNNFLRDGSNDGTWQITWTGTWTKGTIIRFEEVVSNTWTATSSTNGPTSPAATSPYGDGISLSNEGFSVFTASSTTDPDNNVTEIHSFVIHDGFSIDPDPGDDGDCPCSADFVSVDLGGASVDHGQFDASLRGAAVDVMDFTTVGNWTTSGVNTALSLTEFASLDLSALPVELVSFKAQQVDNEVLLYWQTASEENNDYFQLERSFDGRNFEAIVKVEGNGTTQDRMDYAHIDEFPFSGINYYRLKQVDYDGKFEYSEIVSVEFTTDVAGVIVSPNPFNKEVQVQFEAFDLSDAVMNTRYIEVYDFLGNQIQVHPINSGESSKMLDLSSLSSGAYLLRIQTGNQEVISQKIIKM